MKVLDITQQHKPDNSIELITRIQDKSDLVMNFKGASELPFVYDCIFLSLYLQAMQEDSDLTMPEQYSVSSALVKNLEYLQTIFSEWFDTTLSPADVKVNMVTHTRKGEGVAALFSGGVDSFYTYLKKERQITHLFLCLGLDIQLEEHEKLNAAVKTFSEFAKHHNKQLLIVRTNFRHVFPNFNSTIQHAAIFTAQILAFGLEKLYIPASHCLDELFPWGSHLLTDHLLSNGITAVEHHGATARTQKTQFIARNQSALDSLRVCNASEQFNCGRCEKCLRTMFVLELLGKQSACLPKLADSHSSFDKLRIYKPNQLVFWRDNYELAQHTQNAYLAKRSKAIVRGYQWRTWLREGVGMLKGKYR